MNPTARERLSLQFGARFSGDTVRPSSEEELSSLLATLRELEEQPPAIRIDRSLFDSVLSISPRSGLLEVGAGMTLEAVERIAKGHGLTLGPLNPGARTQRVGEFLEGPWAGLRAVPGGRLEPLAMSVRVVLSNGQVYRSPNAPRSAAGPGLESLFFGGGGRLGLIVSAQLRCGPIPARSEDVTLAFPTPTDLVQALRFALDDGAVIAEAQLYRRASAHVVHARFAGTEAGAVKDANTLARRASAHQGRLTDPDLPSWAARSERELTWPEVIAALTAGRPLRLYRLAVETVLAELDTAEAPELPRPHAALWSAVARLADPALILGGER
ncbi:MAG: FAD-binding protein [Myxococcota bacterium]|nr:FAD-binding protein [Myxococcota bacterium]